MKKETENVGHKESSQLVSQLVRQVLLLTPTASTIECDKRLF